jgi:sulfite reductase (NADPH) flavoprotein alpha-component
VIQAGSKTVDARRGQKSTFELIAYTRNKGLPMAIPVDRKNPFLARILERERLTPTSDEKQTFHLALDISQADLTFKAGDSIGIYGQNNPKLVEKWLTVLGISGNEEVYSKRKNASFLFRDFLSFHTNLSQLKSSLLKYLLTAISNEPFFSDLGYLFEADRDEDLSQFLKGHEPLDLLKHCPKNSVELSELCDHLAPMLPRFYSIASSKTHFPQQIDLIVAHLSYQHRGEERFGVASHFLCQLAEKNTTPIPIYIQPSLHFALPHNDDLPIIMIGPGTGIAPFRAFMQERIVRGAKGKNWLFFGERKEGSHFYYRDYWAELEQKGLLRLTTAFSRDQQEKIYVQHRLAKEGQMLWKWIQEGAIIYVCGDAQKMAKEVETCFLSLFSSEGGLSEDNAKAYLQTLRKQKQYLADVY